MPGTHRTCSSHAAMEPAHHGTARCHSLAAAPALSWWPGTCTEPSNLTRATGTGVEGGQIPDIWHSPSFLSPNLSSGSLCLTASKSTSANQLSQCALSICGGSSPNGEGRRGAWTSSERTPGLPSTSPQGDGSGERHAQTLLQAERLSPAWQSQQHVSGGKSYEGAPNQA